MANHKSAAKRARQNEKRRIRNRAVKTRVKNAVREVVHAVEKSAADEAQTSLVAAVKTVQKARSKGVLHKKTASRRVSRLTRAVNKLAAAEKVKS